MTQSQQPSTSSAPFDVIEMDQDHVKAAAFNMVFMVWRQRTLADAYARGVLLIRGLGRSTRLPIGVCQVVETEAVPPEADARKAFVELMRLPEIGHFSVTHDGTGFMAASVRAIVSGVAVLARPQCRHGIFGSVPAAAKWHASEQSRLGRSDDAKTIEDIVSALRALHRARYPSHEKA